MEKELTAAIPEILWVKEEKLRKGVVKTYSDAIGTGGWKVRDLEEIPFTLLIPNCQVSYVEHVRAVTRMCRSIVEEFTGIYRDREKPVLDFDLLIAGALLHDVGKLVEFARTPEGKYVKSALGRDLRHPFSGTVIAMRNGLPSSVANLIATHAKEGDGTLRTPEAVIINKVDMLNFEVFQSTSPLKKSLIKYRHPRRGISR